MSTPSDCIAKALREAIVQAREDSAKLPGPKGWLLAAQAARWTRVLETAAMAVPVPQTAPPDVPELLAYLETCARQRDNEARDDDADRLRRCAVRLVQLTTMPRPKIATDILDAQRLHTLAAELATDPRRALRRLAGVRSLDSLREALDAIAPSASAETAGGTAWREPRACLVPRPARSPADRSPRRLDA